MTDDSKATHILACLPSCMMPDGDDPCMGYHHLHNMYDSLKAERDRLRQMLEEAANIAHEYCWMPAVGVRMDNDATRIEDRIRARIREALGDD